MCVLMTSHDMSHTDELLWDTLPVENNRGQEVRVDAEEWPPSWEQANKVNTITIIQCIT